MKTNKIKDNIHGYIYFSKLEGLYLSHPLVLRLHHVRQNGAAFLTYPSIRVHRYEHSIGAMHLAGELLLRAVRFSDDPTIYDTIRQLVEHICGKTIGHIRSVLVRPSSNVLKDSLYHLHHLDDIKNDDTLALLLMFQSVRVAMLVHDIGHPPFSHTTEMALKQMGVRYADHERVGLDLLALINNDLERSADSKDEYAFSTFIADLVRAIVDKEDPAYPLVQGIATIVSGDVDADRLDYVQRDALSGGLSTNSYDVGRLYDALKLCSQEGPTGEKPPAAVMQYHAAAMSTLEAFFSMRFHIYRWMLFHHSVILQSMALVRIAHLIHQFGSTSQGDLAHACKDFVDLATNKARRREYWRFTDAHMLDLMTRIYVAIETPTATDTATVRSLRRYLDTFLNRSKRHLVPFWKSPADYAHFAEQVFASSIDSASRSAVVRFNKVLRSRYNVIVETVRNEVASGASGTVKEMNNSDFYSFRFAAEIEKEINSRLAGHAVEVRAYYIAKFKATPTNMLLKAGSEFRPLEVLSPTIASLETAWDSLPHLWLFLERTRDFDGGVNSVESERDGNQSTLQDVLPVVVEALTAFVQAIDS